MGERYKLDEQISINLLSLTFVLVKSKNHNYLAWKMTICMSIESIYKIDTVLVFVLLYQSKFRLHVVHFYRIFYPFHDDILIIKSILFVLLLKSYKCLKRQSEISDAVTCGYQSCSPYIATICRNTSFVFRYCCRLITIFRNPSIRIQLEMRISK